MLIGAKLTPDELRLELLKHGYTQDQVSGLEAKRSNYAGHRRCSKCGGYVWNHGSPIRRCIHCGFCWHMHIDTGVCQDCGVSFVRPDGSYSYTEAGAVPDHDPEHYRVTHFDAQGRIVRVRDA